MTDVEPEPLDDTCADCGKVNDLRRAFGATLCRRCSCIRSNSVPHKCRGCGRLFNRYDGMHSTPLDVDGELRLQTRQVRDGPSEPWRDEDDVITRVVCADCCPATLHDDPDGWCSIMAPTDCDHLDDVD